MKIREILRIGLEDVSDVFKIDIAVLNKIYREIFEKKGNESLSKLIHDRTFTDDWDKVTPLGGPGTVLNGVVMYCLMRSYGFSKAFETGVSGGLYTTFLRAAVEDLQSSKVLSVEICDDKDKVGNLIPLKYRAKYGKRSKSNNHQWKIETGVNSLEYLDKNSDRDFEFFCHDSLHTFDHMSKEVGQFKKCNLDKFLIFVDDQDTEDFWNKAIDLGFFYKPGYRSIALSGAESRLKGHLGGFILFEKGK